LQTVSRRQATKTPGELACGKTKEAVAVFFYHLAVRFGQAPQAWSVDYQFTAVLYHRPELVARFSTNPKLVVIQELRMRGSPGDAGGPDPLLRCDKVPASHQDVTRCLRLLGYTREDLLQLLSSHSKGALDWKPKGEPRSVRNALRHVAQVDIWYLSRIEADPPFDKAKMKDVFAFLKYSRSLVAEALPSLTQTQLTKVFYPHKWSDKPYPWTATKVLHRLVTHERQHTNYLRRILALSASPVLRFEQD